VRECDEAGEMSKVSIIIINYNGRNFIPPCLKALEAQSFKDFEIILVDNGSSDDSLEKIRDFSKENSLACMMKIIPLDRNEGFAGGNITGFAHTGSEYVALLNNDTEPAKEWLENLLRAMESDPSVGVCASKMISFGTTVLDSAGDGFSTLLKGFKRGEGGNSDSYNKQEFIFGACAGAAFYRRKMLEEIGFFDQDFFLIHEDTDLNFRAQLAGWKVMYVPAAVVYHKVRSTIGHMSDTAVYYTLRNSEFVRIKNVPLLLFLQCLPCFVLAAITEFLYFAIKHKRLRLYYKAKIDVLRNLRGMLVKRKKIMAMRRVDNKYLHSIMTTVWNTEFVLAKVKKLLFG
jgi:GT2 family glycosyltransferase